MVVSNAAVTPVYALSHTTMCAGHVAQLSIITLYIYKSFLNIIPVSVEQASFWTHNDETVLKMLIQLGSAALCNYG